MHGYIIAPFLTKLKQPAQKFIGHKDGGLDPWFFDKIDLRGLRHVCGVVELDQGAVRHVNPIDHTGCSGDKIQVKLPF